VDAVLGLLAMLGVGATAAGVQTPPGRRELALPLVVADLLPPWATGLVFGALGIGAQVPAATMSVARRTSHSQRLRGVRVPGGDAGAPRAVARLVSSWSSWGALVFAVAAHGVCAARREDAGQDVRIRSRASAEPSASVVYAELRPGASGGDGVAAKIASVPPSVAGTMSPGPA
jgi:hypothetical protein